MVKLTPETINQIKSVIIPEIRGAAEESLRAYEQGARPDGSNNFDNYMLGCSCWDNIYNRLDRELTNHHFFTKKTYKNVMTISCPNGNEQIEFYIFRVFENYRIPCSGKSIKINLHNQLFLSEEIENIITTHKSSVLIIGYDIHEMKGLGKITFNALSTADGAHFESEILYIFEGEGTTSSVKHTPQEKLKKPEVTRELLATHSKNAIN